LAEDPEDEEELKKQIVVLRAEFKKKDSSAVFLQGSNVSLTYEKIKEYVNSYFDKINEAPKETRMSSMLGTSISRE